MAHLIKGKYLVFFVIVLLDFNCESVDADVHSPILKHGNIHPESFSQVELRRSYMNVRISTSSSTPMCVECWSGDHNNDKKDCATSSGVKVLSWNFNQGLSTKFWCKGTWGNKYINQFPVFGDGVPKKSSDWLVDAYGKTRTHEDGLLVNDFHRSWTTVHQF